MNIFLTSTNESIAVEHLDDLRLNKMILETAQLLSQAYRFFFGEHPDLYKNTHVNHPCAVWARERKHNYFWLFNYFYFLNYERKFRTGKNHKSYEILYSVFLAKNFCAWHMITDDLKLSDFNFNCTNKKYLDLPITEQYQNYLVEKWIFDKRKPTWTKRNIPDFALEFKNEILRDRK
jgi:hypothetical protein